MSKGFFNNDTIIAIATSPNTASAIGIVRVSGENVNKIAAKFLQTWKSEKTLDKLKPNHFQRCRVLDFSGKLIDDAMCVFMCAPFSYSGEDILEVHMHGNPYLLKRFVAEVVKASLARPAEAGEFSFRAFQNGKIDLTQAESVMDLISSKTIRSADYALGALSGKTKNSITIAKAELLKLLAEIEIEIDFSDQGLSSIDYSAWADKLVSWTAKINTARESFLKSKPLREGIRAALVGAPNSGKSTLFNTLLGEDRSIVSDIAGTTRDVVRESFYLGELLLVLSDTAGLRATGDKIEAEGINRSYGEIAGAHLVLLICDSSALTLLSELQLNTLIQSQVAEIKEKNNSAQVLVILNKTDLLAPGQVDSLQKNLKNAEYPAVFLSANTGEGLKNLEKCILERFSSQENTDDGFHVGRMRHYELLGVAVKAIEEAIQKVRAGDCLPDLLSSDLRAAMSAIGEITGEVSSDDVLNYIFAEFCIGK